MKSIEIFLKIKKKKNVDVVANDTRIFANMKTKGWLNIEKIIFKCKNVSRNSSSNHFLTLLRPHQSCASRRIIKFVLTVNFFLNSIIF